MSGRHTLIERRTAPQGSSRLSRREALAALLATAAATMSGCSRPGEVIEPFVDDPATYAQGLTERYATTLELGGYGRGVLGLVRDGRPFKLEGNARHPASLGATDVFAEAAILDLFDPQRSTAPWSKDGPAAWEAFAAQAGPRLRAAGGGARLLTSRVTSPTVLAAISRLTAAYPGLRHVRYEPVHDDAEMAGALMAFGRRLTLRPRLADADVVVCLDADPLGPGPDQIPFAQAFAARRRPEAGPVSLWQVFEPALTLTGACADRRCAVRPELVRNVALALAAAVGPAPSGVELPARAAALARDAAADLRAARGRAMVLAGRSQPPEVHALVAWINGELRAPVDVIDPVDPVAEGHAQSLASLASELHSGEVAALVMLDCNPVYDAPADLHFAEALGRAGFSVHAGRYADETGQRASWRLPLSHALESWGDARAPDGTASLVQPLVRTLYDTRTAAQVVDLLASPAGTEARALVQAEWRERREAGFEAFWRESLISGVIAGAAAAPRPPPPARRPAVAPAKPAAAITLALAPSPTVWDGSRAANPWLQECPEPLTKEVWGASLRLGAADAARLGLADGEVVKLSRGAVELAAPVRVVRGQADGVASLLLGGGRGSGTLADGVGVNAAALREGLGWTVQGVRLVATGERAPTPTTPSDIKLDGELASLFPVVEPGQGTARPKPAPSLLSKEPPLPQRQHAWAMAIDTSVCIGCNACVVACQAENNVPVIGADEIRMNRDMHWLRVDRYDTGDEEDPRPGFQPVPCMQCEAAPCEPVCPVEASVHDSEGLNAQVYNRCIGTRFCEANCPYKVRRFNFKDYSAPHLYPVDDPRSVEAQRNPEVSVRARGVMEKCTYCVQRISAGRREAEKTGQPIRDGDVRTACQQACPTNAIVFGDLNDPTSAVSRLRASGRHYALLEELGAKPRTTYLAKVRRAAKRGGS